MNIKISISILFILFLIFSTIGCISEYTSSGDYILNEGHQSQVFMVKCDNSQILWEIDDTHIKTDTVPIGLDTWVSTHELYWLDMQKGIYTLSAETPNERVTWEIFVEDNKKYISKQESIVEQNEQFSWNETRNEWNEIADRLMLGEEI